MWMIFSWNDPRVVWNASLSLEESILVDSTKFWKPEVIVANSIKGQELLHNGGSLEVTSQGNIQWLLTGAVETNCPINIYKFPFDTQTCEIEIGGWFGDVNRMCLSMEKGIHMEQFEENSEFEVSTERITETICNTNTRLFITINLKRRPLFHIFTILLPVVLLHFLNSFVFLLPSQSGEKTSMAVSILLSFQLFLSIIRDSLPENSLTVSLFSLYVSLANFTSVVIVVVNILLLKMKEKPPPKWIYRKVDDTFVVLQPEQDPIQLLAHLNELYPRIKFTIETEHKNQLPFLNVLVFRTPCNQLQTSVYRKPTHTDQYIHYKSNHPPKVKTGVISTLTRRAKNICSTNLHEEIEHLRKVFVERNQYPPETVNRTIETTLATPTKRPKPASAPIKISIPYVGKISHHISRLLKQQANVDTTFSASPSLNNVLNANGRKQPTVNSNNPKCVIYKINCDCGQSYIGETS
ncbi:ligand-gated ion channel 4-like [Haliotis asinina]|uniref:ligand-gated ion channel 4-like n=1 Tax=Haliotis asinina TaxID=109174 RepID=UPI0035320D0B